MTKDMEIICVGNELLIGKTLNTNAQWLAKQATTKGIALRRVTSIPDDENEIANAIRETLRRKPRFVITTGGLGPTFDDKTLEGIAKALNHKLEVNKKALKMVREKYEIYSREKGAKKVELTPARRKMATLPENAEPISNPVGTAPGILIDLEKTILIALPGVPSEMKAIFKRTIIPLIEKASDKNSFYEKNIYAEDVMESSLAPLIEEVMHDNLGVYVKSHPRGGESISHIKIHLYTIMDSAERAEAKLQKAVNQLSNAIKEIDGKTRVYE